MAEQRVLVVSRANRLSAADKKALRDAGILVITVENVDQIRLLTSEPLPFDANDMLRAALAGISGDYSRARAWEALVKIILNERAEDQ